VRLDGQRAAATTIARKRAVFHDALGFAVEAGLLSANPASQVRWKAPPVVTAVIPQMVASPAQVRAILGAVAVIRPDLTAFFDCLYYAALRPEEAVALRAASLVLPPRGWGKLILTGACPRTGTAWTGTGSPYQSRGLKHRPDGAIRVVPIPPVLIALLNQHLHDHGSAADGRLFRGSRGGMLSESVYGRVWHAARTAALDPALAATPLARRPYDLRHAALSLWLAATAAPAEIAARAGNSVRVLHSTYAHCIDSHDPFVSRQIECALSDPASSPSATTSGSPNRSPQPPSVRHMSAAGKPARARPRNHAGCPRAARAARATVS
jgi:integrase